MASKGNVKAFKHVLEVAYGRKGKLKYELMEVRYLIFSNNPTVHRALSQPILLESRLLRTNSPRIIPAVEKSHPPVITPALEALLTNSASRTTSALDRRRLEVPSTWPARADPISEQSRFLGPLSKRREVNIRWRYHTEEWKKILPPLQTEIQNRGRQSVLGSITGHIPTVPFKFGLQTTTTMEDIIAMASPRRSTPTSRDGTGASAHLSNTAPARSARWLRRRYRQLLDDIPLFRQEYSQNKGKNIYQVSLSDHAMNPTSISVRSPSIDSDNASWLHRAGEGARQH